MSSRFSTISRMPQNAAAAEVEKHNGERSAAVCVDNVNGVHGDSSYGDIEVLRWAGLRYATRQDGRQAFADRKTTETPSPVGKRRTTSLVDASGVRWTRFDTSGYWHPVPGVSDT